MLYFLFQIIALIFFFVVLGVLIKNKALRFLLIIIGGLFVVLQIVSIAFNGGLINYRFYEQIHFGNIWSVKGIFWMYMLLFLAVFFGFLFLFNYLIKSIAKRKVKPGFLVVTVFAIGILLFLPNSAGTKIYKIADIKSARARSFHDALKEFNIDSKEYVAHEEIKAKAGKNIIVLSLESLERGYLEPPLNELTPNLNALSQKYAYIKMKQQLGASWTSASMYTAITGIPAYFKSFKSASNSIFQNTTSSKIGNLGSVFQAAGYEMSYLVTKRDFSGMGDMLESFGFEVISDEDFENDYHLTDWGAHDKDMFNELKKEILDKEKQERPYAIFLSTISGHFPNGLYDKRMESVLPKRDNHLEFMASAVDYYIGDLFAFLEKNHILDNTEVFIYPDHKLMGKTSEVIKKFANERGLYVITTAEKNKVVQDIQQPVMQMDIPRMIINGAGIKTNATFLSSFLPENKTSYLYQNRKKMLVLNEAALNRDTYIKGFRLEKDDEKIRLTALEKDIKKTFEAPANNSLSVIKFTSDMRFLSQKNVPHRELFPPLKSGYSAKELANIFQKKPGEYVLVYSIIGEKIYASLKLEKYIGTTQTGEDEVVFTENDISTLTNWTTLKAGEEIKTDELFLKSTGYKAIPKYGASRIYAGFKPLEVKRGVNLLYIDDHSYQVYNTDTFVKNTEVEKLLEKLESLIESKKMVAIVVHDASTLKLENYSDKLEKMGLPRLAKLALRKPYLAIFQDGEFVEKTGDSSIRESLPLKKFPNTELGAIKQDTMRFIAHAGGGINGDTYTNSLEAMNLNYKKGFRLFEIDIIKTSDNVFVAAHDWKSWAKKADYKGETPASLKAFKENPLENYTSMDIHDLNRWFKNHPDAILVTDKVNDPAAFSKAFIDKERLWMELFSLEAAKEAKKLGIEVLLTQTELKKLKGKELETLKNLGIHRIAISRKFIKDHITLLKKLKEAGIKAYAFHLYGRFDTNYVLKYEIDYVYGMYADEWDFGNLKK